MSTVHIVLNYNEYPVVIMMKLRIRDMREDRDLSQRKIAEYLQCDQSLYSKYEREKRDVPLHILVELALFYHTSIDYLVGLTNEPKPYKRST
jgi:transcriptional regulator with XRE-family HTH domain